MYCNCSRFSEILNNFFAVYVRVSNAVIYNSLLAALRVLLLAAAMFAKHLKAYERIQLPIRL